jgi:glycosyltransferase involved in cell wall biosynthesis
VFGLRRTLAERLRPPVAPSLLEEEHPGRPRILFVGYGESTHTHSWIGLLDDARVNRVLFCLPSAHPPADWNVPSFVTAPSGAVPPDRPVPHHQRLHPTTRLPGLAHHGALKVLGMVGTELEERWLADVITRWQPHVVHTLGLDPAGYLYLRARRRLGLAGIGRWLAQTRGGSDLELSHVDPEAIPELRAAFAECDVLLSDNRRNYEIAQTLGLHPSKIAPVGAVPGTGGIDIDALAARWVGPPSTRRLILWPKAFESPWSKALPVFEALKLVWDRIRPCEIHALAMVDGMLTRSWYRTLPAEIRRSCHVAQRVPRADVLKLMTSARVMLAPSLIDGTPNSLFEAMAGGALPIVSPLPTLTPLLDDPANTLFARNLYPEEIAAALARAMTDDPLVDAAAERNLIRVRELADRSEIRPRVIAFYEDVAGSR